MRLLYITNGITGVGGLERVLSIKASYFADKLGYDVHIVSLNEKDKELFYTFSPKITFHTIDTTGNKMKYFSGLRSLARELQPDIISVCDDGLKGFFVPAWIGVNSKIIYERHTSKEMVTNGNKPNLRQKLAFWLMDRRSRSFDGFVVLTNYNKTQWSGKNVVVIPNPVSFYPSNVSMLEQKRIIAVGKVTRHKGYDRLADAWQSIADKYPGWRVDIFGGEDDGGELRKMVEGTNVHINKPVQDIEKEYLSSSIYALPSRFEGFGMVITEAMACGVPCVSFDCPCGPADIIKDGEDGFLVENGNIEQFAQKLSLLIEDNYLRKKMGINARQNVKRYDIEIVGRQWDIFFKEL